MSARRGDNEERDGGRAARGGERIREARGRAGPADGGGPGDGAGSSPLRTRFHGTIAGVGFASGNRFVVGIWDTSPFGAFADVMWSQADGTRVLLADGAPRAFLTQHYRFDEAHTVAVEARRVEGRLVVRGGDLCLALEPGRRTALGALVRLRPRGLTK